MQPQQPPFVQPRHPLPSVQPQHQQQQPFVQPHHQQQQPLVQPQHQQQQPLVQPQQQSSDPPHSRGDMLLGAPLPPLPPPLQQNEAPRWLPRPLAGVVNVPAPLPALRRRPLRQASSTADVAAAGIVAGGATTARRAARFAAGSFCMDPPAPLGAAPELLSMVVEESGGCGGGGGGGAGAFCGYASEHTGCELGLGAAEGSGEHDAGGRGSGAFSLVFASEPGQLPGSCAVRGSGEEAAPRLGEVWMREVGSCSGGAGGRAWDDAGCAGELPRTPRSVTTAAPVLRPPGQICPPSSAARTCGGAPQEPCGQEALDGAPQRAAAAGSLFEKVESVFEEVGRRPQRFAVLLRGRPAWVAASFDWV
eukprot:281817-Chlamydomonas_euryale.AAC.10